MSDLALNANTPVKTNTDLPVAVTLVLALIAMALSGGVLLVLIDSVQLAG